MSAANNSFKIAAFFAKQEDKIKAVIPQMIAETAVEFYKESFRNKGFDGIPWKPTKKTVRKGSLMVRSGALVASIRPGSVTPDKVTIQAGSSKVPYAKIQNEGGKISRAARTETFVRNRYTTGKKGKMFGGMGAYKKGTTAGRGLTFKAHSYNFPARPFMGQSALLNQRIIDRIKKIM